MSTDYTKLKPETHGTPFHLWLDKAAEEFTKESGLPAWFVSNYKVSSALGKAITKYIDEANLYQLEKYNEQPEAIINKEQSRMQS